MTASPSAPAGFCMERNNSAAPTEEEIARVIYEDRNGRGCVPWSRRDTAHKAPYLSDARAILDLFAPILAEKERETIKRIADVAAAVGWQANVGASETAGLIVSVLAANPEQTERFMAEGSELFIDGTMRAENGCLSHLAMNGKIVSPTRLREVKGQSQ